MRMRGLAIGRLSGWVWLSMFRYSTPTGIFEWSDHGTRESRLSANLHQPTVDVAVGSACLGRISAISRYLRGRIPTEASSILTNKTKWNSWQQFINSHIRLWDHSHVCGCGHCGVPLLSILVVHWGTCKILAECGIHSSSKSCFCWLWAACRVRHRSTTHLSGQPTVHSTEFYAREVVAQHVPIRYVWFVSSGRVVRETSPYENRNQTFPFSLLSVVMVSMQLLCSALFNGGHRYWTIHVNFFQPYRHMVYSSDILHQHLCFHLSFYEVTQVWRERVVPAILWIPHAGVLCDCCNEWTPRTVHTCLVFQVKFTYSGTCLH